MLAPDSLTVTEKMSWIPLSRRKSRTNESVSREAVPLPIAIAIGNGTASRETDSFVRDFLRDKGIHDIFSVTVSESGASIYSASDIARQEFPDLDLTVRGAISIARRLQDPLSELVKVD